MNLKRIVFGIAYLILTVLLVNGQNGKNSVVPINENFKAKSSLQFIKTHETLNITSELKKKNAILQLLQKRAIFTPNENSSLSLIHQIESLVGEHFTFVQLYNSTPIYGATIKVNLDKNNTVRSILSNLKMGISLGEIGLPNDIKLNTIINNYIESHLQDAKIRNKEWNYYVNNNNELQLVVKVNIYIPNTAYNKELLLDLNNQIIQERDLNVYYKPILPDSLVSAKVFLPDPLTSAGQVYTAPYLDSNDNNTAVLDAERKAVNMYVDFQNDTFYLRDSFISIQDIDFPNDPIAYSLTPDFDFTRDSSGFEDVNVYFHIKRFQDYVRSLGFSSISDALVRIDPHGTTADNSWFSAPNTLRFGDGGVDDAEDADVIIHEYLHALSGFASPGTNSGISVNGFKERQALDEALGDYFAASYSRKLNPFNWENVFTWDGHNEYWSGRNADAKKYYPEDLVTSIHSSGEIWSSAMMQIWEDIGKEQTDRIMLQSVFSWSNGISMVDAADLVIEADSLLYFGANYDVLLKRFIERGFYVDSSGTPPLPPVIPEDTPITKLLITNTQGFLQGTGNLQITFPDSLIFKNITIDIFDITGRLTIRIPQHLIQNDYSLAQDIFHARGIYLLRIYENKTGRLLKVAKIVK